MAESFKILTPDAQYDDGGLVEKEVAGGGATLEIYRERVGAAIPEESWRQCDGLLVWHERPIDAAIIAKLDHCRIIVRAGVGFDHLDIDAAAEAGIPVCNTPDYGTSEVADHAIAMMLALSRGLIPFHRNMIEDPVGGFDFSRAPTVRRIRGRRLGIVGLGRIGLATALRAKAFGLSIVAYDPYQPRGMEIAAGVDRVDTLENLLAESDIVSLHAPLTAETRGIIDAKALAAMRSDAILINTARGALVDIDALYDALTAAKIGGAALDVLPQEPPDPASPLIRGCSEGDPALRDRVILSPHAAWSSPESRRDARRLSMETMMLYLRDGILRNGVNLDRMAQRR
ncbi:C-terminal binding protein [Fodinicurvata sp. EGI_FJ10296]|uniref:C-terminal binding protein n=1 Tax=Fodinicurvata sp. EGI_FJ10296 TaxID=3231908 RepID=UPI003453F935